MLFYSMHTKSCVMRYYIKNKTFVVIVVSLAAIISLTSCRNGGKHSEVTPEIVVGVVAPNAGAYFDIEEIAELKKVIPLETSESVLMGEISKLEMNEEHIIVLDKRMRAVWLFGIDGKFLRQLGCLGNGPKEYASLDDIYYDKNKETVWIWDRVKQVMLEYDLSGELLNEISTAFISNIFTKTDEGFWLYYSYLKNPDKNSVILVDNEMKHLENGFFPLKESFPVSSKSEFTSWEGQEYFCFPLSNILYSLKGTEMSPYIEFDFGAQMLPYSKIASMTSDEYDTLLDSGSYLGDLTNVRLSSKYCLFQFSLMAKNKYVTNYYGILNLKTFEVKTFSSLKGSDLLVDFSSILCVTQKDELVYPIYPDRNNPIYYDKLRELVPDVTEDSNPILALYKLK